MSDDVEIIVDSPEPSQQRRPSDEDVDVISIDDDEPIATQEKHEDVSPTSGNKRTPPQRAPSARNRARQVARQGTASSATNSKTVDSVIDSIARGRPLHDPMPSWRKPKQPIYYDPALKAAHEQIELSKLEEKKKQMIQQQMEVEKSEHQQHQQSLEQSVPLESEHPAQSSQQYQQQIHPQQYQQQQQSQRHPQQGQPHSQQQQQHPQHQRILQQRAPAHLRLSSQDQYTRMNTTPRPQQPRSRTRLTHAPRMSANSHPNAAPRGLLPAPPGAVIQNSPDDHKFKKPMLPAKHRKVVIDEEKRRKEAQEDAERVQRHLETAKRELQEAAKAKAAQKASEPPRPQSKPRPQAPSRKKSFQTMYYTPAPSTPENYVSPEMKQAADAEKQKICLNQEFIEVPNVLVHSLYMLRSLLNKQTFHGLTPENQQHLIRFLPYDAQTNLDESLNYAFTLDPYVVKGNPVNTLHLRLRNGYFNPEKINELIALRDTEKVEYEHYIRMYHMKLFKRLLVSRTLILQQYDTVHVSSVRKPGPQPIAKDVVADKKHMSALRRRAAKRSRMMMSDCRAKVGEQGLSSDEEGEDIGEPINKALQSTIFQKSTIYNNRLKDLDMWQPTKVDDVKTMLKNYKKFKKESPKAPSLDFRGVKLAHVFDRAGILAQSVKIRETVAALEKSLGRENDPHGRLLFQ